MIDGSSPFDPEKAYKDSKLCEKYIDDKYMHTSTCIHIYVHHHPYS